MRTATHVVFLAALIISCTVCTFAQEALWEELNAKALDLYHQGRYPAAARVAEEALAVEESRFGIT